MSLGYDYYGTVVNTAARVEGVGHGGQTLITEETYDALAERQQSRRKVGEEEEANESANKSSYKYKYSGHSKMIALGPCPIRGLDEPIRLVQIAPRDEDGDADGSAFSDGEAESDSESKRKGGDNIHERRPPKGISRRAFPALRLHIEVLDVVDTTTADETNTGDGAGTGTSAPNTLAAELAHQLCSTRQFSGLVTAEEVMAYYSFVNALIAPTPSKFQRESLAKLGTSWGIENAATDVGKDGGAASTARARLVVNLAAKVGRSVRIKNRRDVAAAGANESNSNSRTGVLNSTLQRQRAHHSSQGVGAGESANGFTAAGRRPLHSDNSLNHAAGVSVNGLGSHSVNAAVPFVNNAILA